MQKFAAVDDSNNYIFQSIGEFNGFLQYPLCDDGGERENFYFYRIYEFKPADFELY